MTRGDVVVAVPFKVSGCEFTIYTDAAGRYHTADGYRSRASLPGGAAWQDLGPVASLEEAQQACRQATERKG